MFKWPAGCSEHQQNAGFGCRMCPFKSLVLSSLQSHLKSAAGREGALCLRLGDVAGFGKAQCVIPLTLPDRLLAHQPCLSFIRLCTLYIYCHLSQKWRGSGGRCGASLLPFCPLSGSSSGVVFSQRQAAADTCQKRFNQGLADQRCWAAPDHSLFPWDAADASAVVLAGCPGRGCADVARSGSTWSIRVPGDGTAGAPRLWQLELLCCNLICIGAAELLPWDQGR